MTCFDDSSGLDCQLGPFREERATSALTLAAGSSGEAGDNGDQLDDVHRLGDVCLKAGQQRATPIFGRASAVTAAAGVDPPRSGGKARIARIRLYPSSSGMPMSATITSGRYSASDARAPAADSAVTTRAPWSLSTRRASSRASGSSSTYSTVTPSSPAPTRYVHPSMRGRSSTRPVSGCRFNRSGSSTTNVVPVPPAFAGRVDGAAVQLDEMLDDRQPQPQSAKRPSRRLIRLAETVEDVGQELRARCLHRCR